MKEIRLNKYILLVFIAIFLTACSSNIEATNNQEINNENHDAQITDEVEIVENEIMETTSDETNSDEISGYEEYEIVTLLPFDAIPAIDDPEFLSADQAESEYAPDELIIGVVFNGEARAYSINYLSRHEIVNDTVGGHHIAVTW